VIFGFQEVMEVIQIVQAYPNDATNAQRATNK
jgi:hypothetical protein